MTFILHIAAKEAKLQLTLRPAANRANLNGIFDIIFGVGLPVDVGQSADNPTLPKPMR